MDAQYKGNRKSFYSSDSSKKTGPAECRRKWQAWNVSVNLKMVQKAKAIS